jgi:hypothetical protein
VQIEPGENLDSLPKSPPALEYDRSGWHVSRRQWRALILLTLLNTVLLGWFVIGPQSTQFIQSQWKQWQVRRAEKARERQMLADQQACLDYKFAPNLVLYAEEPAEAKKLITSIADYKPVSIHSGVSGLIWMPPVIANSRPASWLGFATFVSRDGAGPFIPDLPVVFLGRRSTHSGEEQLVFVQLRAQQTTGSNGRENFINTDRLLVANAVLPATSDKPAKMIGSRALQLVLPNKRFKDVSSVPEEGPYLTLLAGQADAADNSHFFLPYKIDGVENKIDGWVTEDGVILKPRVGQPTAAALGGVPQPDLLGWDLTLPATDATKNRTR